MDRTYTWLNSCHSVLAQWNWPGGRPLGESIATYLPNVTPKAPNPGRPMVRTSKSPWSGYTSNWTGVVILNLYRFSYVAMARSSSAWKYGRKRVDSFLSSFRTVVGVVNVSTGLSM